MKGIVLAGGTGTRLYPLTAVTSKQLLPVYDKPMIYYPLSVLMAADIQDIIIITTPQDSAAFSQLLGDGSRFGVHFTYCVQPSPDGIAQAFIIAESQIHNEPVALILGDNIFTGKGLDVLLRNAIRNSSYGASIFGYAVNDPERYGIIEFDSQMHAISIEEKPIHPKSNYCVTGLYFYDKNVCSIAKTLIPSQRGEYEISDLNQCYLNMERLHTELLDESFHWLDTGTQDSLTDASLFIRNEEKNIGKKIGCLEEIAYTKNWIGQKEIKEQYKQLQKSSYGQYVLKMANLTE